MVVTKQNRQDFENAKRFFEGFSFTDIKISVESGCFKKADIARIEEGYLEMNFASLKVTFYIPAHATIGSVAEVYDENGDILGAYDFSKKEVTLDEVRDFFGQDAKENVKAVLMHIQNNFLEEWTDFVGSDVLDKNKVIEYIMNNQHEIPEIMDNLSNSLDTDDIPSDVKENIINDWFANSSHSDVIYKVQDEFDLRDFVKDCIDEL